MTKYKLNFKRDVDTDEPGVLILNLPAGFCFYDEECHTRGYESFAELKDAVKWAVIPCDCKQCQQELAASK
jgi:hypothetical protein